MVFKRRIEPVKTVEGLVEILNHISEAKIWDKLTMDDLNRIWETTLKYTMTPENLEAIAKGFAKGLKGGL